LFRHKRLFLSEDMGDIVSLVHTVGCWIACSIVIYYGKSPFWEVPGTDNTLTPAANRLNDVTMGYFFYDTVVQIQIAGGFVIHHLNSLAAPAFVMYSRTCALNNVYNLWFAELGGIAYQIYVNGNQNLRSYTFFVFFYGLSRLVWTVFVVIFIVWYVMLPNPFSFKLFNVAGHCGIIYINITFLKKHLQKLWSKWSGTYVPSGSPGGSPRTPKAE
jgi:hypothetical protein